MEITGDMKFRTIKQGTTYALCKSLYCKNCGHLFVNYRFDDDEMSRLYKDYRGTEYCLLRSRYEPGYALQNDAFSGEVSDRVSIEAFLCDLINPEEISVLDWGGDKGKNTPFTDKARTVHIYEPSGVKPEVLNAVNVSEPGEFLLAYDLIVLSNVLEHIPFPAKALKTIVDYMSASTVLFIEVPYETIQFNASGQKPFRQPLQKLHWHEHINFFSLDSLASLLDTSSLEILRSQVQEVNRGNTGVSSQRAMRFACRRK